MKQIRAREDTRRQAKMMRDMMGATSCGADGANPLAKMLQGRRFGGWVYTSVRFLRLFVTF